MAVVASHHRQDWAGAEAMLAEAQALWQGLGDRRKVNARLRNRAQCWVSLGQQAAAVRINEMARQTGLGKRLPSQLLRKRYRAALQQLGDHLPGT